MEEDEFREKLHGENMPCSMILPGSVIKYCKMKTANQGTEEMSWKRNPEINTHWINPSILTQEEQEQCLTQHVCSQLITESQSDFEPSTLILLSFEFFLQEGEITEYVCTRLALSRAEGGTVPQQLQRNSQSSAVPAPHKHTGSGTGMCTHEDALWGHPRQRCIPGHWCLRGWHQFAAWSASGHFEPVVLLLLPGHVLLCCTCRRTL